MSFKDNYCPRLWKSEWKTSAYKQPILEKPAIFFGTRLPTHGCQPPALKTSSERAGSGQQENVHAAVHVAWHIPLQCRHLVCGAVALDGYQVFSDADVRVHIAAPSQRTGLWHVTLPHTEAGCTTHKRQRNHPWRAAPERGASSIRHGREEFRNRYHDVVLTDVQPETEEEPDGHTHALALFARHRPRRSFRREASCGYNRWASGAVSAFRCVWGFFRFLCASRRERCGFVSKQKAAFHDATPAAQVSGEILFSLYIGNMHCENI